MITFHALTIKARPADRWAALLLLLLLVHGSAVRKFEARCEGGGGEMWSPKRGALRVVVGLAMLASSASTSRIMIGIYRPAS